MRFDARVPIRFADRPETRPGVAVLVEGRDFTSDQTHALGCGCCIGRSSLGTALGELFVRRATGQVPFFTAVVVVAGAGATLAEAVRADPVANLRYRLA